MIKALSPYFRAAKDEVVEEASLFEPGASTGKTPEVLFAGHHLSGKYLTELLDYLEGKSVYVNMISKSGTTLEPGIAFRVIRDWMEARFEDSSRRIMATTDAERGALRALATEKGYRTHIIPDDVGGRFSVLTPVGLLPIAAAGFDIRSLFYGAVAMMKEIDTSENHAALDYAARRYALHESGFTTEVLSVFEPSLSGFGGWWQQLFGESEGKEHKGIFPTTCLFSTDLHSLGQYLQEGRRNVAETFLTLGDDRGHITVPEWDSDADGSTADGLSFVAGKTFSDVTQAALHGTMDAHVQGECPFNISKSSAWTKMRWEVLSTFSSMLSRLEAIYWVSIRLTSLALKPINGLCMNDSVAERPLKFNVEPLSDSTCTCWQTVCISLMFV